MEKGVLFKGYFILVLLFVISDYVLFASHFLKNRPKHLLWLVAGFGLWIMSSLHDGLVAAGLFSHPAQPWIGPMVMVFCTAVYLGRMFEDQTRTLVRVSLEKQHLEERINQDALTGLRTRPYFHEIFEFEFRRVTRAELNHCLMFLDLDNFKSVNDVLGHAAGDEVLKIVGEVLHRSTRVSDVAARFGGDEFMVLLSECSESDGRKIAGKILSDFRSAVRERFRDFDVSALGISIGLLHSSSWKGDLDEIMEAADRAMYRAKAGGKDQISI